MERQSRFHPMGQRRGNVTNAVVVGVTEDHRSADRTRADMNIQRSCSAPKEDSLVSHARAQSLSFQCSVSDTYTQEIITSYRR
uniref:Uncharacterized protein n=1 Tax=Anguilla anguilla TaxID=7936 RepID=A0A0E9WWL6_ANGAN